MSIVKPKVVKKKRKKQIWIDEKLVEKARTHAKNEGLKIEYVYEDIFKRGLISKHIIPEEGIQF